MERLIFDTHAHYTSAAFRQNREELLAELPQNGVALVMDCATDYNSALQSIQLAKTYDYVYSAVGVHPQSLIEEDASTQTRFKGDWREELRAIAALYDEEKVKAVGEVGLDHHWPVPRAEQLLLFEEQLKIAAERNLPVIIHDREAHEEIYTLVKKYKPIGVLHSYSGSAEDVHWLCKQGMYIGMSGVVTFKNARRPLEVAAVVPDEYLLLETDAPYLTPEPYRGKKNNSMMIQYTAQRIAEVRGVKKEDLMRMACRNGMRLFGISG